MMYDLSSCTRILTTPIPLSYTRHTTRFMVLWLFLLPLALHRWCGWGTPWAVALISLALLTIGEREEEGDLQHIFFGWSGLCLPICHLHPSLSHA